MTYFAQGSIIGGRYRIERLLARGGMGSVWAAQHIHLGVRVAVKLMDPSFASSGEAQIRFEREAIASAKLDSPHIVRAIDYGIEAGQPYLVMELLQGEDLGARLRREQVLSLEETATIISQVCKALRCAHEAGFVHRDLKPANIFLARQQDEVIAKVLDFGIAKSAAATEATKTGVVLGSPHYMSPEQARNSKQVDLRSDLWSLGVIAFRCLTGRLPFPGEELTEVILAICTGPIPVASQNMPHLGPGVDHFLQRALARDVTQRFQSAREFGATLAALARATGSVATSCSSPVTVHLQTEGVQSADSVHLPGTLAPTGRTLAPHNRRVKALWAILSVTVSAATASAGIIMKRRTTIDPENSIALSSEHVIPSVLPPATPASSSVPSADPGPASGSSDSKIDDGGAPRPDPSVRASPTSSPSSPPRRSSKLPNADVFDPCDHSHGR